MQSGVPHYSPKRHWRCWEHDCFSTFPISNPDKTVVNSTSKSMAGNPAMSRGATRRGAAGRGIAFGRIKTAPNVKQSLVFKPQLSESSQSSTLGPDFSRW